MQTFKLSSLAVESEMEQRNGCNKALFGHIKVFYNGQRRHSSSGYVSSVKSEHSE